MSDELIFEAPGAGTMVVVRGPGAAERVPAAEVRGVLAVTPAMYADQDEAETTGYAWRITHLPTGRAAALAKHRHAARALLAALVATAIPWDTITEETPLSWFANHNAAYHGAFEGIADVCALRGRPIEDADAP